MKKRLRRKKRLGEFRELGFEIGFKFSEELNTEKEDLLIDKFLNEAIEANGLCFGGEGSNEWMGFAASDKPFDKVTDSHREAVEKWLANEPEILEYYISPLVDAWYGDLEELEVKWINKKEA